MRPEPLALAALACALIAAALWTVGGPDAARAERRDALRLQDLTALQHHMACMHGRSAASDQTTPAPSLACPTPQHGADRWSGQAYDVQVLDDGAIRACATFEKPDRLVSRPDFDPMTGCLTQRAGAIGQHAPS